MKARAVVAIAAVFGAVAAGVAIGSIALATSGGGNPPRYDHISSTGSPFGALSADQQATLAHAGAVGGLNVVRRAGGTGFYVAHGAGGGLCFATGGGTGDLEAVVCPTRDAAVGRRVVFPSTEMPILDLSPVTADPTNHTTTLLNLQGFAADGVARVGVVDQAGVLHAARVASNTYQVDGPIVAQSLVAFDASGAEIYRDTFSE